MGDGGKLGFGQSKLLTVLSSRSSLPLTSPLSGELPALFAGRSQRLESSLVSLLCHYYSSAITSLLSFKR